MLSSVSFRVSPVATQPGKSGQYAEKLFFAFSTTIKNRRTTIFLSSQPLAVIVLKCYWKFLEVDHAMDDPSNGDSSWFLAVFKLPMTTLHAHERHPAPSFHESLRRNLLNQDHSLTPFPHFPENAENFRKVKKPKKFAPRCAP